MSYSIMEFQQDIERQADAGLTQAARAETQRNIANEQLDFAEDQQTRSGIATLSGAMFQDGLTQALTTPGATTTPSASTLTSAAVKGAGKSVGQEAGKALASETLKHTGKQALVDTTAQAVTQQVGQEVVKQAGTQAVGAAAQAGAAGTAKAAGGTLLGMGPVGWMGLAGLLATTFL